MDVYLVVSAVFGLFSAALSAGSIASSSSSGSAPQLHSGGGGGHLRTKRCSCATFLDKECVYFCHLDIIWVNTPERVVSYGLGNAPRTKRSAPEPDRPRPRRTRPPRTRPQRTRPRCRCLRKDDHKCNDFCQRQQRDSRQGLDLSPKPRTVMQSRSILEKWALRRRHKNSAS